MRPFSSVKSSPITFESTRREVVRTWRFRSSTVDLVRDFVDGAEEGLEHGCRRARRSLRARAPCGAARGPARRPEAAAAPRAGAGSSCCASSSAGDDVGPRSLEVLVVARPAAQGPLDAVDGRQIEVVVEVEPLGGVANALVENDVIENAGAACMKKGKRGFHREAPFERGGRTAAVADAHGRATSAAVQIGGASRPTHGGVGRRAPRGSGGSGAGASVSRWRLRPMQTPKAPRVPAPACSPSAGNR